jgi:hypothetical protein
VLRVLHAGEQSELLAGWFGVAFFTLMIGNAIFRLAVRARPVDNSSR